MESKLLNLANLCILLSSSIIPLPQLFNIEVLTQSTEYFHEGIHEIQFPYCGFHHVAIHVFKRCNLRCQYRDLSMQLQLNCIMDNRKQQKDVCSSDTY